MIGIAEDIGGGLIDRDLTRTGGWIRLCACVDGQCFEIHWCVSHGGVLLLCLTFINESASQHARAVGR